MEIKINVINLFKILADEKRVLIIKALLEEDLYGEVLAERLELSKSTVSFHLKKMAEAGLVSATKDQYYVVYSLKKDWLDYRLSDLILLQPAIVNERERIERYRRKVIESFFQFGKLKSIPVQRKKRRIILEEIVAAFAGQKKFQEKEVNLILAEFHDDFCFLRRELIAESLLVRNAGVYAVSEVPFDLK